LHFKRESTSRHSPGRAGLGGDARGSNLT
jgi:hypothetical protein